MVSYWLFKEEPTHYSFKDLVREGRTVWDGVENNLALKHLRNVRKGDEAFFYHTGEEKAIVGIMKVVSDPYIDPKREGSKYVVVDVVPIKELKRKVTLEEIKKNGFFSDFDLVKLPRLSVMPVPERIWRKILEISESQV